MSKMRKALSWLLALVMVLSLLPVSAFAKANDTEFHIMEMSEIKNFVRETNNLSQDADVKIYGIAVHGESKNGKPATVLGSWNEWSIWNTTVGDLGNAGNVYRPIWKCWSVTNIQGATILKEDSVYAITIYAKNGNTRLPTTAYLGEGDLKEPNQVDGTLVTEIYLTNAKPVPQYTLTYDANGGEGTIEAKSYEEGTKVTVLSKEEDGLTRAEAVLLGFSKSETELVTSKEAEQAIAFETEVTMNEAITLYAVWAQDKNGNGEPDYNEGKYTVTYTDGVEDEKIFEDVVHSDLLLNADTPAAPSFPERDGYVFAGWKPEVAEKVTETVTYEAQWDVDSNGDGIADKNQVFIQYVAGENGELLGDTTTHSQVFDVNEGGVYALNTPQVQGKPGYTFDKWLLPDGLSWDDNLNLSGAQGGQHYTITATFKQDDSQTKNVSCTVEYYLDGVKDTTGTISKEVWAGAPDTLDVTLADITSYEGYVLDSTDPKLPANVASDSTIKVYYNIDSNGDNIADKDQIHVIYSVDLDKGTVGAGAEMEQWLTPKQPGPIALNAPQVTGKEDLYEFTGWSGADVKAEDGYYALQTYTLGQTYTLTAEFKGLQEKIKEIDVTIGENLGKEMPNLLKSDFLHAEYGNQYVLLSGYNGHFTTPLISEIWHSIPDSLTTAVDTKEEVQTFFSGFTAIKTIPFWDTWKGWLGSAQYVTDVRVDGTTLYITLDKVSVERTVDITITVDPDKGTFTDYGAGPVSFANIPEFSTEQYELPKVEAKEGYKFTGWTMTGNEVTSLAADAETFVMTGMGKFDPADAEKGTITIEAQFEEVAPAERTVEINFTVNPEYGYFTEYDGQTKITFEKINAESTQQFEIPKVTAKSGYKFVGWKGQGADVIEWDANATTFGVSGLCYFPEGSNVGYASIEAVFEPVERTVEINFTVNPEYGYFTEYDGQTKVTFKNIDAESTQQFEIPKVTAKSGYKFVGWKGQGADVIEWDANATTFGVSGLCYFPEGSNVGYASIEAVFEPVERTVEVTFTVNPEYGTFTDYGEGPVTFKNIDAESTQQFDIPKVTANAGYKFVGWKGQGADEIKWDANATTFGVSGLCYFPEGSNVGYASIEAVFEPVERTVEVTFTVNPEYGSFTEYGEGPVTFKNIDAESTQKFEIPEVTANAGYKFVGWKGQGADVIEWGADAFEFGVPGLCYFPEGSNVGYASIEAVFEPVERTVEVTFTVNPEYGSFTEYGEGPVTFKNIDAESTQKFEIPEVTANAGYKFVGWKGQGADVIEWGADAFEFGVPGLCYFPEGSNVGYASIEAVFEPVTAEETYTVHFYISNAEGASYLFNGASVKTVDLIAEYSEELDTYVVKFPKLAINKDYEITGWQVDGKNTAVWHKDSSEARGVEGLVNADNQMAITPILKYTGEGPAPETITFTYKAGSNGWIQGGTQYETVTLNKHGKASPENVPAVRAYSGYEFIGWRVKDGSNDLLSTYELKRTSFTEDTTFVAQYKRTGGSGVDVDDEYDVIYNANFTDGGYSRRVGYDEDDKVTVSDNKWFEREGYTFIGWNTKANGNGDSYLPGDTFRMPDSDVYLYAQWQKNKPGPDETGVSDWLNAKDHIAYMTGYPDKTFGPNRNMTRAEVAQMFYALLKNQNVTVTASFSDVPANAWYAKAVNTMATLGMVTGYPDGTFHPDATITRAEFTTIALAFADGVKGAECNYYDVLQTAWFYDYIAQATEYGWIGGSGGYFRPNDMITRAEVSIIVNNMLGRSADTKYVDKHEDELVTFPDVKPSYWAYYSIMETVNGHEYTMENGQENWK